MAKFRYHKIQNERVNRLGIEVDFVPAIMKKFLSIFFLLISLGAFSQETHGTIRLITQKKAEKVTQATIMEGDTIPFIQLQEVAVFPPLTFDNRRERKRFNKLVRHVKKVYPYAKLAAIKLKKYEKKMRGKSESEQRKLMRQAEQEIRDEFEGDLKKLTFTQGRILLKLIDRETGNTSYHLVEELRGNFMAFFWQSFARIFGYNLKKEYDPDGRDANIELIVQMIENGAI